MRISSSYRFEPLLGPIDNLNLSGRRPRELNPDWVRSIREQCVDSSVAFFFKQWGGTNKKKAGRLLDGRTHDQLPSKSESASGKILERPP